MITPKATIIVEVRCPTCGHLACKVKLTEGEQPNSQVETRCRVCKTWIRFPDDSALTTRQRITEG